MSHATTETRGLLIEHPEAPDDRRVGIGEQRIGNMLPVREVLQDRLTVVADGSEPDSTLSKLRLGIAQLDQLLFAVGSPIGRAEEQEDDAIGPRQTLDCLF